MSRILVIHHDHSIRSNLEAIVKTRHEVEGAKELIAGIKQIARRRPDLILVSQDAKKEEGTRLLKYLKDNELRIPVVVVASRGAGVYQPTAMRLGARAFIEYPVDEKRLTEAMAAAQQAHAAALAGPPPITDEELSSNLSVLESKLNRAMKCFAGRNQVYIQSIILGGRTTKPRIALKCGLRAEYGLSKDVYYEFVRDVCCCDPAKCEAIQKFQAERESA